MTLKFVKFKQTHLFFYIYAWERERLRLIAFIWSLFQDRSGENKNGEDNWDKKVIFAYFF